MRSKRDFWIPILLITAVLAASCLSKNQSSTLENIEGALSGVSADGSFVEAYIEYSGPKKKWAGPPTFILHIQARDPGNAKIWVTPPIYTEGLKNRIPASEKPPAITTETARERLGELAAEIAADPSQSKFGNFQGCLYPVRAWLINSEGGILEKHGCRGQTGWVKKSSFLVSDFIAASLSNTDGSQVATLGQ